MLVAILLLCALPAEAQLRAPLGPQPFDGDDPPRRHSIVTVWAEALDSLSHPNPLLRWNAARLAAVHSLAFDDDELTRAWMRERDPRVRVALKRTLIARGKGDELLRTSSTPPGACAGVETIVRSNETRPIGQLLQHLESATHKGDRQKLLFELALALRISDQSDLRERGLERLRNHAFAEQAWLLRAVARDASVVADLLVGIKSNDPFVRRDAVDALFAVGRPQLRSTLYSMLQNETHPDVIRALLKAMRGYDLSISPSLLTEVAQRVRQHRQEQDDASQLGSVGYEVEFARAALRNTRPHELLYQKAQRTTRRWLTPTSPLAGLALHLMQEQKQVPIYTAAPFVDDPRSYVREAALRLITRTLPEGHSLRGWLAHEALDSYALERLQPGWTPPAKEKPAAALLVSADPLLVAWESGHELSVPTSAALLFEPRVPPSATFCRPAQTWLSFDAHLRDL